MAVIIPARNEEKFIDKTLTALFLQHTRPSKVIVVNDGSTDRTGQLATAAGAHVINMPDRGHDVHGTPILASVLNHGLRQLQEMGYSKSSNDYIMILGADHILPPNYIATILDVMETDKNIVICSGQIKGERKSLVPRGSGRIVRAVFWSRLGFQYPENYGFETYLLIKAEQYGFRVKVLDHLISETMRKTGRQYKKNTYIAYGKSLKALGYNRVYALAKIGLLFIGNPKAAFYTMKGYFSKDVHVYEQELRQYLNSLQYKKIRDYVTNPRKIFTITETA